MNKNTNPEINLREQLRLKLLKANALVIISNDIEEEGKILSTEAILAIGQLPPDAPSSTELIDEGRGTY